MDYLSPPVKITRRNVTRESYKDGDTETVVWHTPRGDLREIIRTVREETAVSSNRLEHMVKGPEDIPALASIFEDEVAEPDPEGMERTRERKALIGDDGMLMHFMAGTPMGMMFRRYSGVATLSYLWADARDALRDLFAVMEKHYRTSYAIAAQSKADILVGMDDTSTTAISPAMFEEFNIDLTNGRARLAHAAGKLYFHHSCGLIKDLLPLYRQTEMDAVHAFTVPPVGNATIADGRRELGGRITIIAGLKPLGGSMTDVNQVREDIRSMVDEIGAGDHMVLGLAAYPDKTMEQTQMVLDYCREYLESVRG